ncbi:hypothetical protein [uncultured Tenacibaculum sp.]|uniref:hypothetical protein n=1 Tax=uncultured Tenacibaculum sp. TaxID=174713 RepID=UPI00261D53C8|nr:hypothetical protein [uncultured Tenacibaculum sp.]
MKHNLSLFLLMLVTFFYANAQEINYFILIEKKDKPVIKIKEDKTFFSIKVLMKNKRSFSETEYSNEVVISKQPQQPLFYEFQSYKEWGILKKIDHLELNSIEKLRANKDFLNQIFNDYNSNVHFIIKYKNNYKIWKTKPIYLE